MKHWRRVLAIIVGLGLALAWPGVPLAAAGGTVTIDAPAEAIAGSDFIARVAVDDVQDFDACGFDVVYDHTVITVTDVTGGEIAGHAVQVGAGFWSYIPVGTEDTGRIRVIAFRPGMPEPGVTGAGHVAQIHFEVIGPAGETSAVRLESVAFYDWQGDPIGTSTEDHAVLVSAPTEPTIALSPRSFSFSAAEGGANPAGRTLEIWNSGPGTLDWSVSGNAQWLSLSPSSGTSTGERTSVTVSVDIAGMTAGDYAASITIAAPGAANSPRTVNVGLEVSADSGTPVNNDNDRPPARPPLILLWIALGAVAIAVVTLLVLKRRTP